VQLDPVLDAVSVLTPQLIDEGSIGIEPGRIDVLTKITGVDFLTAWAGKTDAAFGDVRASVIGLDDLLANKRAAGRPQDLADVAALERLRSARGRAPR